MVWNWSSHNTIVFGWWRTDSVAGLTAACLAALGLSVLAESVKSWQQPRNHRTLIYGNPPAVLVEQDGTERLKGALVYGLRIFLGALLMLIMMTFNGFLILAIVVGAMLGQYVFGPGSAADCH